MIVDENDFVVGANHHIKKGLPLKLCSLTLRDTYSEKVV